MFGRCSRTSARGSSSDVAALFARYHHQLRNRVRAVVQTSEANVEDACMYAWLQLLGHELDEQAMSTSWLTTVAIREAVRLDRDQKRALLTRADQHAVVLEQADPRDPYAARDLLSYAATVIQEAGLTARQLQMISLQLWGLTYEQIAANTGATRRTVERQVLRAHEKIAKALQSYGG